MVKALKYSIPFLLLIAGVYFFFSITRPKPPIIVILIDTLRADHLGFFGYERRTSPQLDRFAREGIAFTKAISPAPWTPAAVASILTGLYPSSHGFMPRDGIWTWPNPEAAKQNIALSSELETLAESLKGAGYTTLGISSNPWVSPDFNFTQGYEGFLYLPGINSGLVTKHAMSTLQRADPEKPFFLYLHYMDPHEPYAPPEAFKGLFEEPLKKAKQAYSEETQQKMALYDGEIRFTDSAIGTLFRFLKAEGLYEKAAIVVLADHGEQFGEHGNFGHGNQLFNEELHVPLFIKPPGRSWKPRTIDTIVSTMDLSPTLLELARVKSHGRQAFSLLRRGKPARRTDVFSEIKKKYTQRAITSLDEKKLIVGSLQSEDGREAGDPAANLVGLFDLKKEWYEREAVNDPQALQKLQESFRATLRAAEALRKELLTAENGAAINQ